MSIHLNRACWRSTLGAALLAPAMALAQVASDDTERGRALYMQNGCYTCHGTVGQGGERSGAPKLAPEPYPYGPSACWCAPRARPCRASM